MSTQESALQEDIRQQINGDLQLLLLPTIAELKGINFSNTTVKLLNSEKLLNTSVTYNGNFYNSPIRGNLMIHENNGEI